MVWAAAAQCICEPYNDTMKHLLLPMVVYVVTGTLQPMLTDIIRYSGGTGPRWPPMFLPVLANVVGMSGVSSATACLGDRQGAGVSSVIAALRNPRQRHKLLIAAAIDLASGCLLNAGLLTLGGAVYVVIYASNTLWTALFSVCCGGRRLSLRRWAAVFVLTAGIVMNGLATSAGPASAPSPSPGQHGSDVEEGQQLQVMEQRQERGSDNDGNGNGGAAVFGTVLLLCGTVAHSAMFVVSAQLMGSDSSDRNRGAAGTEASTAMDTITGHVLCSAMGFVETIVLGAWNVVLWWWRTGRPSQRGDGDNIGGAPYILVLYAALAAVNMVHALVFFSLLRSLGPVPSAAMKGAQTLLVFLAGAIYFCPVQRDQLQCATAQTTVAMLLVLAGLLGFALSVPFKPKAMLKDRGKELTP